MNRRPFFSRHFTIRYLYALAHPLAICVALGAMLAGLAFLIGLVSLDESALAEWLPSHFTPVWAAIYCAGGALAVFGIFAGRPNLEAPGFVLLGSALLASAIAVFSIRGFTPGLVAGSTIGPCAIGVLARALILTFVEPRIGER